jgi:two-component system vancomycin resistance associated response regulator VraR
MAYNVLIVEDQSMPRQLFEIFVNSSNEFNHVASLADASLALTICQNQKVDLILMDVFTAQESNGLNAAKEIKKLFPNIKIIIVTSMPEYSWIEEAKNIGVDSFWYKETNKESILEIMLKTMHGEHIYPQNTFVVKFGNITNHDLTKRELQILKEMLAGDSNAEIAKRLYISSGTVKRHIENMLLKTGFHTRTELAAEAGRLGIVIKNSGV